MPITVLVADDKEIVLSSIRLLFDFDPEIRIVGEVANFRQTLERATELKPQIVIIPINPDDMSESAGNQIAVRKVRLTANCNVFLD